MNITEYIQAKWQEYDSGDVVTKQGVVDELETACEKVQALRRKLVMLEIVNEEKLTQ